MSESQFIAPLTLVGFDAAQDCTRIVPLATTAGVAWIARYLSFNPSKNLSRSEADAILAAGMDIVSIWQNRGRLPSDFTPQKAFRDATEARALAQAVGQPPMTAIFFAVDFDASISEIITGVIPYFRTANEVLAGSYRVGVYGSGLVCSRLDAENLVLYDWLAGAMGWQGSRAYANAHLTEIEQGKETDPWGFGFNIDTNTAPAGRDFGSWHPQVGVPPVPALDVIEQILEYGNFRAGVQAYQQPRGLVPDGQIGPRTLRAIGEDMRR